MTDVDTPARATQPPSREQLLYWLHEAAEIEHNLMCCYLYAAFSLKRTDTRWSERQAALVGQWRRVINAVALEEMSHLCLVGNLMNALGSPAHFNRPAFPIDSGPYPSDFVIRLQPFSVATVEHFQFLERPQGAALQDGDGYAPRKAYRRTVPPGRLSPAARDYTTVGELYETLRSGLAAFAAAHGEAALFIGNPARQVDASLAPLPGVGAVTDLASAQRTLDTIVTQGEGAGDESIDSHYCRFTRMGAELHEALRDDPQFEPAWPAATNPVMNPPPTPDGKVHIDHPVQSRWLDIGNAMYTTSLRCLLQGFAATDRAAKATWLAGSFALMRAVVPVGQGLAARSATSDEHGPRAGLSFTPLRTLTTLPACYAAGFVAERLDQLRARALELPLVLVAGETASSWQAVIDALAQQQAQLTALQQRTDGSAAAVSSAPSSAVSGTPSSAVSSAPSSAASSPPPAPSIATPAATPAASSTTEAPAAPAVEVARGRGVTVHFEARRCIHSRHCVLDAPTVFKANTPGEWIYPDTVPVETVVAVAHSCPSGAIRYERHDGGPAEPAPRVNQLRLRENGPYAVHAPITLVHPDGHSQGRTDDGLRATLCRCGHSARKPWCDGSHVAAGFIATGEPPTGAADPLAQRDGPFTVTPLRDGPLQVQGNLEICAGTGRTVARITEARLCRCGQSRNKPFCDLSHVAAGFAADGV